jgi:hypothetical protein
MNERAHWDQVYERRAPDQVSWYRPHLERSLALIDQARLSPDAGIIDVGGGSSTLVDDLLERGFTRLTVLGWRQLSRDLAREPRRWRG